MVGINAFGERRKAPQTEGQPEADSDDDVLTVCDGSGKLDVGEFELQLFDSRYMVKEEGREKFSGWLKPSCIPISIILILIVLVVLLPLLETKNDPSDDTTVDGYNRLWKNCSNPCVFTLTESIPENLTYPRGSPGHVSTFDSWLRLINQAESTIDIASFYWTMQGEDIVSDPSDWQGEEIFQALLKAGTEGGIKIRIAQDASQAGGSNDTMELGRVGAAEVRSVDFKRLLNSGVLHTKFWLVDNKHFYVGSANMDWRSLTQVKELGATVYNCSCLASDLKKIFEVYWFLGKEHSKIPPFWPHTLATDINLENPVTVEMNGTSSEVYFASSPAPLCPRGRTTDIDSILDVIGKARSFVDVAVMDYFPTTLYTSNTQFWPMIDDALRKAAVERQVSVRLLAGYWNHTKPAMLKFIKSLAALNGTRYHVETKLFVVPTYSQRQSKIPFARVAHNKYMVTDNKAYIGTSNWSGDYFINTGGVGLVVDQSKNNTNSSQPIREALQAVFERDWNSAYARPLVEYARFR